MRRVEASPLDLVLQVQHLRQVGKKRRLQQPIMLMRMVEAFFRRHPVFLDEPDHMDYFWAHMLTEKYSDGRPVRRASTVAAYMECARKYNIRGDAADKAWRRIHDRALRVSIDMQATEEKPLTQYEVLARELVWRPVEDERLPLLARTAAYLILATGCRAEHLNRMSKVECGRDGLLVTWQRRKILGAMRRPVEYRYEWSRRPPRELVAGIENWPRDRGDFSERADGRMVAANRINSMIRRCTGEGEKAFSSSYYRRRMSSILSYLVNQGEVSESLFRFLMDHRYETSYMRYVLPGDVRLMIYPVE